MASCFVIWRGAAGLCVSRRPYGWNFLNRQRADSGRTRVAAYLKSPFMDTKLEFTTRLPIAPEVILAGNAWVGLFPQSPGFDGLGQEAAFPSYLRQRFVGERLNDGSRIFVNAEPIQFPIPRMPCLLTHGGLFRTEASPSPPDTLVGFGVLQGPTSMPIDGVVIRPGRLWVRLLATTLSDEASLRASSERAGTSS